MTKKNPEDLTRPTEIDLRSTEALVRWFRAGKRDLPWRHAPSPYAVWVSEIMLQQTQVATVVPYFQRFMTRFPTVDTLASASETEVLKAWEGLGYYARARNLHQAARGLVRERGGVLPDDYAELRRLKGLGDYAAAAVASIAFGVPVPSVDGNVRRVTARLFAIRDDIRSGPVRKGVFSRLERMIRSGSADLAPGGFAFRPGEFNEALMELGATVCVPRQPRCPACPLESLCVARLAGIEGELPRKTPKPTVPLRHAVCLIVSDGERLLLWRRASRGLFGGLWEFPWVMVEAGPAGSRPANVNRLKGETERRTDSAAVVTPDEVTSALAGLSAVVGCGGEPRDLGVLERTYSHFRLRMRLFVLGTAGNPPGSGHFDPRIEGEEAGRPSGRPTDRPTWVTLEQARSLPFHGIARQARDRFELGRTQNSPVSPARVRSSSLTVPE